MSLRGRGIWISCQKFQAAAIPNDLPPSGGSAGQGLARLLFAASFSEAVADPRDIFASMLLVFVMLIPFFFAKGLIQILRTDEIRRLLFKAHAEG